ncbi:jg25053, partial [Pararge aegeria aegeria]
MINDLPQVIQDCKCWLFADDLKLSRTVDDGNDCTRMQQDIDRVVKWSKDNHLQFNTSKCATITFSKKRSPIRYDNNIDGVSMTRVSE